MRRSVHEELIEQESKDEATLTSQRKRVQRLERARSKLLDAYLAEAISVTDLKDRQAALALEQREAERLIELSSANHKLARQQVEAALELLQNASAWYGLSPEQQRQQLNLTFFGVIKVGPDRVMELVLNEPFAYLHDRAIGLAGEDGEPGPTMETAEEASESRSLAAPAYERQRTQRPAGRTGPLCRDHVLVATNPGATYSRSSNLGILAEREGFEPSKRLDTP